MEGTYDVYCLNQKVGSVEVKEKGLFYVFHAKCKVDERGMYSLVMEHGDGQVNLGIMIPENELLTLRKQFPMKRAGKPPLSFYLKDRNYDDIIDILNPDVSFLMLHRLEEAYLEMHENQHRICFKKSRKKEK